MKSYILAIVPFVIATHGVARAQESSGAEDQAEVAEEAEATEEDASERPLRLADRIKAVQRKVFIKKKRFEFYPTFGLDLNDPFYQHLLAGGAVSFHLADAFALEARGGLVIASLKQAQARLRLDALLPENPPEMKYHADLDLTWSPIYGKVSLFGDSILHFDTFLTAGPGVFGTDAGANPAVNIGVGQRYFVNRWLAVRWDIRDYIFVDQRNQESDLQNLLIFSLSLSGFLPTSFEYEYQ